MAAGLMDDYHEAGHTYSINRIYCQLLSQTRSIANLKPTNQIPRL